MTTIERYRQAAEELIAEWRGQEDTGGMILLRQALRLDEEERIRVDWILRDRLPHEGGEGQRKSYRLFIDGVEQPHRYFSRLDAMDHGRAILRGEGKP